MAMSFLTLMVSTFIVAIPAIAYYLYWAIWVTRVRLTEEQKAEVLRHTKTAYIIIALVIVYIPGMLVYFLYTNLLYQFPDIFKITIVIFSILTFVFEVINVLSYRYYERKKIIES